MAAEFRDGERDLFGMDVLPPRERGRPARVPTPELRNLVNMLFVAGHDVMTVAKALRYSRTAFYTHFRAEIDERKFAAVKFKGRQMMRLNDQAEQGNVAAEKALAGMLQAEQLRALGQRVADRGPAERKPVAPALGKKEIAKANARGVMGLFGTRQPPASLQ